MSKKSYYSIAIEKLSGTATVETISGKNVNIQGGSSISILPFIADMIATKSSQNNPLMENITGSPSKYIAVGCNLQAGSSFVIKMTITDLAPNVG